MDRRGRPVTVHLAPSLVEARASLNARWPQRDKTLDGWIGDAAHQARVSDHNPNSRGSVDAIDVDAYGGATPVHRPTVIAGAIVHPSTHYVIHDRRIYQREDDFRPRLYTGTNNHAGHIHISIQQTVIAENSHAAWVLYVETIDVAWPPTIRRGDAGTDVQQLQAYLNAWGAPLVCDGAFGPATDGAVRTFQRAAGIGVDGIVGPQTRKALMRYV